MSPQQDIPANRLARESSPYLLQHAHNPVDWYPWGPEALERARREQKLLLVSIGYSSCHWCHVMERESFVDHGIAELMNRLYVCVKVDREERPDVDHVYMTAVQLMTGSGGWPLNCFALPDGRPVYGGTYFPPQQWQRVLTDLDRTWREDPERVMQQATRLQRGVAGAMAIPREAEHLERARAVADEMVAAWAPQWDQVHGGADRVPKFPMPNNYAFLLRHAVLTGDRGLLAHVELTLDRMAMGGIFDQIGGGFARYSTDALWKVPHFEKMLYDNAQLIALYSQAWQVWRKPLHRDVVERTIGFIEREMRAADGSFCSALDADTEGEEGRYYTWTEQEIRDAVGDDWELVRSYYDIGGQALWEHGRNILRRGMPDAEFAKAFGLTDAELSERLDRIRGTLLTAREARHRPASDDKALTSWNALMIHALCVAGDAFGCADWIETAGRDARQLLSRVRRNDGGVHHSWKAGEASINGYLEDYAFLCEALVALYECTFEERWLLEAKALIAHARRHFLDEATGFFHFTSDQDPRLIARPVELEDNVVPASNSSLAKALHLVGTLLDDAEDRDLAGRMLAAMLPRMSAHPWSHSNWGTLAHWLGWPFHEIAITGPEAMTLREELALRYIPCRVMLGTRSESTLPLLTDKRLPGTTIHVCIDHACRLPVHTVKDALEELR
ncbi:MAG: thioredoxin domain-containing protein [Flavobacteriales bacterium]|nr:thioredoxin domain-containing protein [Flavobacteriales bacterium]